MLTEVLDSADTARLGIEALLKAGSYDLGPKGSPIEDPAKWTDEEIVKQAKSLVTDKGPEGNFED
jgi:fructose-bisphosphate aldolase, class II